MFVDRNEKGDIIAQYSVMQYEGQEELVEGSESWNVYQANLLLKEKKIIKTSNIKEDYSKAQFGLVKQNGSVFKVALSGESWLDFERQVLKASANGVADFVAINEAGILKVLKDIPFSVLQPLYKNLCDVSVGNFTIKNELLYQVSIAQDSSAVENIVISFPKIQTFTIG